MGGLGTAVPILVLLEVEIAALRLALATLRVELTHWSRRGAIVFILSSTALSSTLDVGDVVPEDSLASGTHFPDPNPGLGEIIYFPTSVPPRDEAQISKLPFYNVGNNHKMVRKLKHHEQKLLRKVDFTTYKSDNNHRDAAVIRRYVIQKPGDYQKYNKICGVCSA